MFYLLLFTIISKNIKYFNSQTFRYSWYQLLNFWLNLFHHTINKFTYKYTWTKKKKINASLKILQVKWKLQVWNVLNW